MSFLKITRLCFLILFLELMLIRWLSTEVNILAYLQNSILVACFLGLGMGLISPKPKDSVADSLLPLSALGLLIAVPFLREGIRNSSLGLAAFHDFVVWNGDPLLTGAWSKITGVLSSLFLVFATLALCWAAMVPLGAELGRLFERSSGRLQAYSADILGSLLGVLAFSLLAYLSLNPFWWTVALVGLLLLQEACRTPRALTLLGVIFGCALFAGLSEKADITVWTPYQKLQFEAVGEDQEWRVIVNNSGFQQIQNNSSLYALPVRERIVEQYNIPARLAEPVRRALVVGAGTGNDVAGLIAHTDAEIVAVDIDPLLLKLGAKLHPEKPYSNPRVRLIENDARAIFLNQPAKSYDLIVFGLLDSHTTPNLSNARLDNFVYTKEAITAAKRLLTDDGILCIIFLLQRKYIAGRLSNVLESVFQQRPRAFDIPGTAHSWGGTAFVVGDTERLDRNLEIDTKLREFVAARTISLDPASSLVPITTDNWPYLYIEKPSIPVLFFILAAMFVILWIASSYRRYGRLIAPNLLRADDLTLTMLGVSFSLIQVFSINKASILFGSTWFVNSAVISGILAMILLANLIAARVRPSFVLTGLAVVVLTIALGSLSLTPLLEYPILQRAVFAGAISGLPLLLSGILFAQAFNASSNPGRALGANLFGAMIGGILQLITFRFGIASTIYLAAFFYLVATFAGWRWLTSVVKSAKNCTHAGARL